MRRRRWSHSPIPCWSSAPSCRRTTRSEWPSRAQSRRPAAQPPSRNRPCIDLAGRRSGVRGVRATVAKTLTSGTRPEERSRRCLRGDESPPVQFIINRSPHEVLDGEYRALLGQPLELFFHARGELHRDLCALTASHIRYDFAVGTVKYRPCVSMRKHAAARTEFGECLAQD